MGKGQELYKKAKQMIPGGTMLLSKRPRTTVAGELAFIFQQIKRV